MAKQTKRNPHLTEQRKLLLIGIVSYVFLAFLPTIVATSQVQQLVALNITAKNFLEVTKMPGWWAFVPLAVFVIVGLVYLWMRAGKKDNTTIIIEEIRKLARAVRKLEKTIKDSNSGKETQ
jgi:hypothetical protein